MCPRFPFCLSLYLPYPIHHAGDTLPPLHEPRLPRSVELVKQYNILLCNTYSIYVPRAVDVTCGGRTKLPNVRFATIPRTSTDSIRTCVRAYQKKRLRRHRRIICKMMSGTNRDSECLRLLRGWLCVLPLLTSSSTAQEVCILQYNWEEYVRFRTFCFLFFEHDSAHFIVRRNTMGIGCNVVEFIIRTVYYNEINK